MRQFLQSSVVTVVLTLNMLAGGHIGYAETITNQESYLIPNQPTLFTPGSEGRLVPVSPNPGQVDNQNVNLLFQGPQALLRFLFGLFTLIGILAGMYAGSLIVFSQGNPKKVQQGFFMLLYTAIGFIIIGSAWFVIRFLLNFSF